MKNRKLKPRDSTRLTREKDKNPVNPVKELNIDEIVDDFGDRVMKGEKVSIDSILKEYPKLSKKLKPKLEIELLLIKAGSQKRKEFEKATKEHKRELWEFLEQKLLAKQTKAFEKRLLPEDAMKSLEIKDRADFLAMFLYVKGKTARLGDGIRGITRLIKLAFLLDKETKLSKLVKSYYDFIPYKIGPFDPKVYQDLQVMEMAKLIRKHTYEYTRNIDCSDLKIDEGFKFNNVLTVYTLTEKGMRYAEALVKWANKKDETIVAKLQTLKSHYGQSSLKQLLRYIYKKYPEYTTESEILEKIIG